jgi:endonuclease YncB( thermonuclease family)
MKAVPRLLILALPALAASEPLAARPPGQGPATGVVRYVTDGDTFRLTSGERIRIAGIDAPETHRDQAHCAAEIVLGDAAAQRARTILDRRRVSFVRVGRSYNRTVARVMLDGRDVGQMFIDRGIASAWPRGRPKPGWCGN